MPVHKICNMFIIQYENTSLYPHVSRTKSTNAFFFAPILIAARHIPFLQTWNKVTCCSMTIITFNISAQILWTVSEEGVHWKGCHCHCTIPNIRCLARFEWHAAKMYPCCLWLSKETTAKAFTASLKRMVQLIQHQHAHNMPKPCIGFNIWPGRHVPHVGSCRHPTTKS